MARHIVLFLFRRVEIPSLAAKRSGRWAYQQSVTVSCKRLLVHVLEPLFDTRSMKKFRLPTRTWMPRCTSMCRAVIERSYVWVVDADLKGYFDTIPKDRTASTRKQKVSDSAVLRLIEKYLEQRDHVRAANMGLQKVVFLKARYCLRCSPTFTSTRWSPDGREWVSNGALRKMTL